MGYVKHNAVIVTNWNEDQINEAREKAIEILKEQGNDRSDLDGLVSDLLCSRTNGQYSFFIAPDGSKEGWDTSDRGDKARQEFLDWLRDSLDNYCQYIEVKFGGDDEDTHILRTNDMDI